MIPRFGYLSNLLIPESVKDSGTQGDTACKLRNLFIPGLLSRPKLIVQMVQMTFYL